MNKKLVVMLGVVSIAAGAFARPGGFHHGGFHHGGPHHYYHHHCHGWGAGGRYFWPGFVGGVVGGAVVGSLYRDPVVVTTPTVVATPAVVTAPTVVTQPVVVQQPTTVVQQPVVVQPQTVWVEGRYVDQQQANGTVVRVWQPGHYEQR